VHRSNASATAFDESDDRRAERANAVSRRKSRFECHDVGSGHYQYRFLDAAKRGELARPNSDRDRQPRRRSGQLGAQTNSLQNAFANNNIASNNLTNSASSIGDTNEPSVASELNSLRIQQQISIATINNANITNGYLNRFFSVTPKRKGRHPNEAQVCHSDGAPQARSRTRHNRA